MEAIMVEIISTTTARPRISRPGEDAGVPVQGTAAANVSAMPGASVGATAATGDSVALSAAAQALPAELKSGPPVDLDAVKKIKDAIAHGKYPIDVEAITESLFQNYLDLVS
jgi:negative regulator of flagellin synthesis FlgM